VGSCVRRCCLAVVVVAALALSVIACRGDGESDGPLTLDEYFERLESLTQDWLDAREESDQEAGERYQNSDTEEEQIIILADFVEEQRGQLVEYMDNVEGLEGPAEVVEEQAELVSTGRVVVDMYENALIVYETAETFDEAAAVLESPGFEEAAQAFGDACRALVTIAVENNIEVDLGCPLPPPPP